MRASIIAMIAVAYPAVAWAHEGPAHVHGSAMGNLLVLLLLAGGSLGFALKFRGERT